MCFSQIACCDSLKDDCLTFFAFQTFKNCLPLQSLTYTILMYALLNTQYCYGSFFRAYIKKDVTNIQGF